MNPANERLREERVRLGMTQEQMAQAGGVQRRAQANYEGGERTPDLDYLSRVAARGVDVLFVVTGRREAPNAKSTSPLPDQAAGAEAQAPALFPAGVPPSNRQAPADLTADHPVTPYTARPGDSLSPGGAGLLTPGVGDDRPLTLPVHMAGGFIREYKVLGHITERVCAGIDPREGTSTTHTAPLHERAGLLAVERGFLAQWVGQADIDELMTLTVEGDSMSPTLAQGDIVVVDTRVSRVNVSGIYVLRFGGELTLKRVMRKSDGALIVTSDNRAYAAADETFGPAIAHTVEVVGRMVWPRVR